MQVDLYELQADQQELRGSLMNGYNFSESVRQALAQARQEADGFRHPYVDTEHVLLGLLSNPANIAVSLLASRDVHPGVVRDRIQSVVRRGTVDERRPDLPYTTRAKRIIELAMREAREASAGSVHTGHLFTGVILEEKGIGASVLAEHGFTADAVRDRLAVLTREGHSEIHTEHGQMPPSGPPAEMHPSRAAALLTTMFQSPRVAAVFERHGVDVQAVIRDLLDDQPRP